MKLTGLTPNIFTRQIDRSVAFYRDLLGFHVAITVPDAPPFVFVSLARDGVVIFLNDEANARKEQPNATWLTVGQAGVALFLDMEGIDELWDQLKDRVPVVQPIVDQWYGVREFSVTDPDGYVVTFAEKRASK
jgi:uncharacterized glyoxalase superfamily protein PhnB